MARRERLGDERHAGGPFSAHPEAEQDAEHRQLRHRLRQPAGGREDRVDQHRRHQRALPADAVGDDAEGHAAGGRGEQRRSPSCPATAVDSCRAGSWMSAARTSA